MKKVAILGAGISGLAAAWFLKKRLGNDVEITLYEKSARIGGWISTKQIQGFVFEEGPRGFRPSGRGKVTLELVQELGLKKELISANPESRKRYISLGGKLRPFSFAFLLKQGFLGGILRDSFTPASSEEDETIADFTCRRFNNRLAETVMDPLAQGVFGGDCRKLSIRSCLPFLWELEREKRSVLWGFLGKKKEKVPTSLYSFREGMETLPKVLAQKVDARFLLSHEVLSLEEIDADWIISALPTSALSGLVGQKDPLEYATLSVISFGWEKRVLKKKGYGFLVPSKENAAILGMTWDSQIFPCQHPGEYTRICVMIGGAHSEKNLYETAVRSLSTFLGITQTPTVYSVKSAKNAIPQYTLYHHRRIEAFKKNLPPHLFAIGNCFEGVSINDCIFNAKKLVDSLSF